VRLGDIAMRIMDYVRQQNQSYGSAHVTVLDLNPDMLRVGKQRFAQHGLADSTSRPMELDVHAHWGFI
jgi:2-methoxy-6-polyprenyl-1,4-benzoquinol methylase